MKLWTILCALSLLASQAVVPSVSGKDRLTTAASWFERLKGLEGRWVAGEDSTYPGSIVETAVIASGNAVVEREFPGTEQEMLTVFYLDGDDLLLTHFCMLGNQPHMRAALSEDPQRILFQFTGATGLDSPDEPHIHTGVITFLGPDQLLTEWTIYENGEPSRTIRQEMTRKKS